MSRSASAAVAARYIRRWRDEQGWTQAEAAAWWGCDERTWRRYELGERTVPKPLLKAMSRRPLKGEALPE